MFFSFVGLVLAAVWSAWLVLQRCVPQQRRAQLRPVLAALAVVALCGYGYGAHRRNAVWHDEESLWRDDIEKSPHNGRGLMIYGLTQMNQGRLCGGARRTSTALWFSHPTMRRSRSTLVSSTERWPTVEMALARSRPSATSSVRSRSLRRTTQPHTYYGQWLSQHGRATEAIAQLQAAIALDPQRLLQHDLLLDALLRAGNAEAARQAARETLDHRAGRRGGATDLASSAGGDRGVLDQSSRSCSTGRRSMRSRSHRRAMRCNSMPIRLKRTRTSVRPTAPCGNGTRRSAMSARRCV